MKKIAIVVAVLLLAAPAMAKVTAGVVVDVNLSVTDPISVTMEGEAEVTVTYDANANVRAFALDLTVDGNATVSAVAGFHTGESTEVSRGFGIFPASFNREIDADDPNWADVNYTPVAHPCDLPGGTQGGEGTDGVTIEMGSLYVDDNSPPLSDTLFNIYVLCWDPCEGQDGDVNMHIEANVGRGKVVLEDGNEPNNLNFPGGNPCRRIRLPFDWGDAPDNAGVPVYPTLLTNNGARHVMVNNARFGTFCLGSAIDRENDGQPIDQDDAAGTTPDDEEGVTNLVVLYPQGSVDVFTSTPGAVPGGYLNAWIDFNIDGDWDDAGEKIFSGQWLNKGANPGLTFTVPLGATLGPTWSRWRFSTKQILPVRGAARNGEVEDEWVPDGVICHVPDVVDEPNLVAQAAIIAAGFAKNVIPECNDVIADGNVIRTVPPYCNYPPCGSTVDIYVSTGPCFVDPNLNTCWDNVNQCAAQYAPDAATAAITGLGGDSDCDGSVNFGDLAALMRSWGGVKGVNPEVCDLVTPAVYCCCTDWNHDFAVNFGDLAILMATWGNVGAAPATLTQSCPP